MTVHFKKVVIVPVGYEDAAYKQWMFNRLLPGVVRSCDQLMVETKHSASLTNDISAVTCPRCLTALGVTDRRASAPAMTQLEQTLIKQLTYIWQDMGKGIEDYQHGDERVDEFRCNFSKASVLSSLWQLPNSGLSEQAIEEIRIIDHEVWRLMREHPALGGTDCE